MPEIVDRAQPDVVVEINGIILYAQRGMEKISMRFVLNPRSHLAKEKVMPEIVDSYM